MFKNTASQKLNVFVFDSTTNLPKTGDAANLTAYVSIDNGTVTVLGDTTATEKDSTNAKGFYLFDLTQAETNGDILAFSCKSSTANMVCICMPAVVFTRPINFTSQSIDSNGRIDLGKWIGTAPLALSSQQVQAIVPDTQKVDVNTIKTNPVVNGGTITFPTNATVASTTNITSASGISLASTQTFNNTGTWTGDISGSVGSISGITFPTNFSSFSIDASGRVDLSKFAGTSFTDTSGRVAAAFSTFFNVASPVLTTASVNQTGDSFVRIGSTGSGLTSLAPASTALSNVQWTNVRADLLDNLDAAITSRLASASYVSPPSAASIVTTLLTDLTSSSNFNTSGSFGKLIKDNLDTTVSSRSTYSGSDTAGTTTLLARLTGSRANYLDNLNIGGNVASSSEVTSIQNNTTTSLIAPENILIPTSGTLTCYAEVYLTDEIGNMEAPDSAPTMTLVNAVGADLSARLTSTTGTLVSTGVYYWEYTSTSTDVSEQIRWQVSVIEGGVTRKKGAVSWVVNTSATDFTSSDRTTLNNISGYVDDLESRLTVTRAGLLDNLTNLDASVSTRLPTSSYVAPDNSSITAILEDTGTTIPAQISGLNNISSAQVNTQVDIALADVGLTTTVTGRIDANITSRLASADYTAPTTDFTSTDRTKLEGIYNKLPSSNYLLGTANSNGTLVANTISGNVSSNVVQFGGTNGTFLAGVPSVNTIWWSGMVVETNSGDDRPLVSLGSIGQDFTGYIDANITHIKGDMVEAINGRSIVYTSAFFDSGNDRLVSINSSNLRTNTEYYLGSLSGIRDIALTEGAEGRLATSFSNFLNVATPHLTVSSRNQTGDSYAIVSNATFGNEAIRTSISSLSIPTAEKIADITLRRSSTNIENSSDGDSLQVGTLYALIRTVTSSSTASGDLVIYKSDGSELGTRSVSGSVTDTPISTIGD